MQAVILGATSVRRRWFSAPLMLALKPVVFVETINSFALDWFAGVRRCRAVAAAHPRFAGAAG